MVEKETESEKIEKSRERITLEMIKKQLEEYEKAQTEKDNEIARLNAELERMKALDSSKYMFPEEQIITFEEIAKLTKANPVLFRNSFLDDPDNFIRAFIRGYFGEADYIANSLRIQGMAADDSTYQDTMNELMAFKKKHPACDMTDDFPKDYEAAMIKLEKFVEMVKKLTTVRIHIVRRSITMTSMLAYWLHTKMPDKMIISPNVAQRLNKTPRREVEPIEDETEERDDVDELLEEPKKEEKKEGIVDKVKGAVDGIKEKAEEFFDSPPVEPEGEKDADEEETEEEAEGEGEEEGEK